MTKKANPRVKNAYGQEPYEQTEKAVKKSKWREERSKFIQAVRLGKQIHQLEKNPNLDKDEGI